MLLGAEARPETLQGEVPHVHGTASGKGVHVLTRPTNGDGAAVLLPADVSYPILPCRHIARQDSREAKQDRVSIKSCAPQVQVLPEKK